MINDRYRSSHLEKLLKLFAANHLVVVGVDGVEEQWQRTLERRLERRVVHEFAHALDEHVLTEAVAAAHGAQVLVPHLRNSGNGDVLAEGEGQYDSELDNRATDVVWWLVVALCVCQT